MSVAPTQTAAPAKAPQATGAKGTTGAPTATSPFAALLALLGGGSGEIKGDPLKALLADHAAKTDATGDDLRTLLDDVLTSNGIALSEDELAALLEAAGANSPLSALPPATPQASIGPDALLALTGTANAPDITGAGQPAATQAQAGSAANGATTLPEALRALLNATSANNTSATPEAAGETAQQAPLSGRSAIASVEELFGRASQAEGMNTGQPATANATTPNAQSFADRLLQHAMARQAQSADTSLQALVQTGTQAAANTGVEPVAAQTSIDLNAIAASGMDRPVIVVRGEGSSQGQGALPLTQIAVTIQREAANGNRRFEIQLDPPDLGRIDVRLEMTRDGRMLTNLTVDRPETLDHLMRDARQLERALMNSGLKLDDSGLQFSLRDQGQGEGRSNAFAGDPSDPIAHTDTPNEPEQSAEPAAGQPVGGHGGSSGLDLMV